MNFDTQLKDLLDSYSNGLITLNEFRSKLVLLICAEGSDDGLDSMARVLDRLYTPQG